MIYLSMQKLVFNREGFLNPYSFLISLLLVLFGTQGIAYGFSLASSSSSAGR
jgi:hypothetical protein